MPFFNVTEPYLNLWLHDIPIQYTTAYGPEVALHLAYHARTWYSAITGVYWHGAQMGNQLGRWSCSWLSFVELSQDESMAELMLPAGAWATFNFPSNSNISSINYRNNLWLEKQGPTGGVTNMVLHYKDGSQTAYAVSDPNAPILFTVAGLFYVSSISDPSGQSTTFSYNTNFYLTNVTAADGTTFALQYTNPSFPDTITGVSASYGASVSLAYDIGPALTNIVDAAGISSHFTYYNEYGGPVIRLTTPYGTSGFNDNGIDGNSGIFDRVVQLTNAVGQVEFYGMINSYTNNDWPNYLASQIPTNTPVGTLDTDSGSRQERNTFYWNAQRFDPYLTLLSNYTAFGWAQFKAARIRHWLASTDGLYTHWQTLSLEQAPSPDGGTTEGEISWYDYINKPARVDYEIGTQILPSVMARVLPDGTTAYGYFERLTNGYPTLMAEHWVDGADRFRTNTFSYASNNIDFVAWTDALGVLVESNVFNAFHQLVTNYDALNEATTLTYDSTTHLLTSVLTPAGLTTTNIYDGTTHRLLQTINLEISRTNSYTWNSDGTIFSHANERGLNTTYSWDGLHRLIQVLYPDGTTISNRYDIISGIPFANGSGGTAILDLTGTKDRSGYWKYFVYDATRRRVFTTNANNIVTAYGYCDCGSLSSLTNALGTAVEQDTAFVRDNQGQLVTTYNADGYNVTNWFDPLGRLTATADGTGYRYFNYNNLGLLTTVSNLCGLEQTTVFDLLDRPIYLTDANGVTTTNTYDNLNRIVSRGHPDGGVESFGYSARGPVAYTNQLGFTNFYVYDAGSRKIFETNALAQTLRYTNNAASDLLSLTDGRTNTTHWKYDEYGRVTNKIDQAGTVVLKYAYDPDSRITNRWSAAFGNTVYKYDPLANLTNIAYPHSGTVNLQFDPLNRLTNMVDSVGTTKYSYTAAGQLFTEDGPFASDTVTNIYSNRLRTALGLQRPSGDWTNGFAYDLARRLTNVVSPAGSFTNVFSAGVRGASGFSSRLIQKLLLPDLAVITNNYDPVARLLATHLRNSSGVLTNKHEYQYDLAGERTNQTRIDGVTVFYGYDKIGQLRTNYASTGSQDQWAYGYDPSWNLTKRTNGINGVSVTTLSYNSLNELTTGSAAYDANGNLTTSLDGYTYVYDDENRLIEIRDDANCTHKTDFTYDGLGRLRIRDEYDGSVDPIYGTCDWTFDSGTRYIYDAWRVIEERDSGNNPQVDYTRGLDLRGTLARAGGIGGLLARTDGNGSTFYHCDGVGNITMMLDTNQAMVASYRYNDAYGYIVIQNGTLATANTYRFSSKECITAWGIYCYGYRFYDPYMQRWINRDPLGEYRGINLYTYVANGPLIRIDFWGLQAIELPDFPPEGFIPGNGGALGPTLIRPGPLGPAWEFWNYEPGHLEEPPEGTDPLGPGCAFGCPPGQCPGHVGAPPPPPKPNPPTEAPPGSGCPTCPINGPPGTVVGPLGPPGGMPYRPPPK
jgi:RHS repeat-associated protein